MKCISIKLTCFWIVCTQFCSANILPFEITINNTQVEALRQRLKTTTWPTDLVDLPDNDWSYGIPSAVLHELTDYLTNEYDFTHQIDKLNEFDHFLATTNNLDVHFIHQKSSHTHAVPLMFVHGKLLTTTLYNLLLF
jgi:epoxide hydrolase